MLTGSHHSGNGAVAKITRGEYGAITAGFGLHLGIRPPMLPEMHILLVEDDRKTAALLSSRLTQEGCSVVGVSDGDSGLDQALKGGWDAIITDIMLPKRDGLSLVRELRSRGDATPVLMLSARGEVDQRVEGLDAGADDYLPKPFAMSELLARLRSLSRRNAMARPVVMRLGELTFDPQTRETRLAGKRVELSMREGLLLECLMKAEGAVVSRRDIIASVWEYDFDPGTNLVEVYVRRLREKIDDKHAKSHIQTVRGLGYALQVPS